MPVAAFSAFSALVAVSVAVSSGMGPASVLEAGQGSAFGGQRDTAGSRDGWSLLAAGPTGARPPAAPEGDRRSDSPVRDGAEGHQAWREGSGRGAENSSVRPSPRAPQLYEGELPVNTIIAPASGPVLEGGRFGWRIAPDRGGREFHNGTDVSAAEGLPVVAALDGVVTDVFWDVWGGNRVEVTHADGLKTTYNHLKDVRVEIGDELVASERLGTIGQTGIRVTGPHLHFETWVDGAAVDPQSFDWIDGSRVIPASRDKYTLEEPTADPADDAAVTDVAKADAEKKAQEETAAEKKAAEKKAAEKKAAEQKKKTEAEKKAAEQKKKTEAEKKEAEQKAAEQKEAAPAEKAEPAPVPEAPAVPEPVVEPEAPAAPAPAPVPAAPAVPEPVVEPEAPAAPAPAPVPAAPAAPEPVVQPPAPEAPVEPITPAPAPVPAAPAVPEPVVQPPAPEAPAEPTTPEPTAPEPATPEPTAPEPTPAPVPIPDEIRDTDGDGKLDVDDDDIDGDGKTNDVDDDIDGDGKLNAVDDDIDGDGLLNEVDPDRDGDGKPNAEDEQPDVPALITAAPAAASAAVTPGPGVTESGVTEK
ncbi:hypothetical protein GCM10011374_13880 [Kocuria dechangensis]|uniref:M23ase beta-sheet core domain-containing protein n=1 Tax=Kocuria dechangensis TaxID=1176249 RepID=A0A917GN47_9MICC|nr:M23 family metallopeptidase [Kocuria dechangensis]GGG52353.1 hypothetical protein GCM10011374_13880 [Kocuria dechangensis]